MFLDEHRLRIGTTDFYCAFPLTDAPPGLLPVMKDRGLVERYIALTEGLELSTLVELGIRRGGSTALLAELTDPDTLVALEIHPTPAPALTDYIDRRGLGAVVRPYYGVDQSDRASLVTILAAELGDRPIDLVIDDASHRFHETRSSFETLFPRLRPGGKFVIEDWNGDHLVGDLIVHALQDPARTDHREIAEQLEAARSAERADAGAREIPLTHLAVELLLARASSGDAIREIEINGEWVTIERGADPLDPETFRLSELVHDHFGFLGPER